MRFPTIWYKARISLCICTVWSEPFLVAWIFYDCWATDWTAFRVSKLKRRLHRLVWGLHLSKCHIVGNHTSQLNCLICKYRRHQFCFREDLKYHSYSVDTLTWDRLLFAKIIVIFLRFCEVLWPGSCFYLEYEDNVNPTMQRFWWPSG